MRVILPPPNSGLSVILDTIRRAFIPVVSQNEAAPRILLSAPNGTVYEVKVDNSGVLSASVFTGTI